MSGRKYLNIKDEARFGWAAHRDSILGLKMDDCAAVRQSRQLLLDIRWDALQGTEDHKANTGLQKGDYIGKNLV